MSTSKRPSLRVALAAAAASAVAIAIYETSHSEGGMRWDEVQIWLEDCLVEKDCQTQLVAITVGILATVVIVLIVRSPMLSKALEKHRRGSQMSPFELWQEAHNHRASLEEQLLLAMRLYNESGQGNSSGGKRETQDPHLLVHQILHNLPSSVDESHLLVRNKGIHVGWFLNTFCESPYMERLRQFGCPMWFIRKVCTIELLRRSTETDTNNSSPDTLGWPCRGALLQQLNPLKDQWSTTTKQHAEEETPIVGNATRFVTYLD